MAEIVFFKPRSELNAQQNLNDFIEHCRDKLTLYEDQGGFLVNTWHFDSGGRKYAMTFSKYKAKSNPYDFDPLDEPLLSFAKAYIRYTQSQKQVKSVSDKMVAIRALHDSLLHVHGDTDVLKTDGLVQAKIVELLNERYPGSAKLFRIGGQLVKLYDFLIDKAITPTLPSWKNPWKRPRSKAEGTDKESRKWQEERCPSQHQMLALADCFARAETKQDRYWSSVLALLMFAPSRAGELMDLTTDSLHEEEGRLGVRWYGEKGFGYTIKWVPEAMEEMVREAFARLIEIGQPAREAAKFAYENPGVFCRHDGCITPSGFPEDKPLNALEFAHAMNFGPSTIASIVERCNDFSATSAWEILGASNSKWVKKLREAGDPTYQQLAQYVLEKYSTKDWPMLPKNGRPVWEALLLIRDQEFHAKKPTWPFSWIMPTVNQFNDQLAARKLKNPIKTIFQRFELVDEDGSDIELTSHQLRVWLSTNAERGGMDSWKLAQWAGRARIQDNRHYDLRTEQEREDQVKAIMAFEERPTALEAIKLNLPVAYADLGLNRVGIADVTEYGMCTHDYAMSPCTKGGECMTCKEHVCIKGMPKTLERIKRLENQVESQLNKAQQDASDGVYGASRWEQHFSWKLAHIRTQRIRLESDETPEGAVLWIPPEHDPSPVQRALEQQGYKAQAPEEELVSSDVIAGLLGDDDA